MTAHPVQLDLFDPPAPLSAPTSAPVRRKGTTTRPGALRAADGAGAHESGAIPARCTRGAAARLVHPLRLPALVGRLRPPGGGATEAAAPVSIRAGAIAAAADRAPVSGADFAALLPDVARRLLGDPPRATAAEWRYGSHGSLSVPWCSSSPAPAACRTRCRSKR